MLVVLMLVLRVSGCAERLFYHPVREPTPAPAAAPGARVVRFDSRDGTRLCGWFIPAVEAPRGAPAVLFVHGNAGNLNMHYGFVETLPRRGFGLFLFDYRGYGESEGRATARGPLIDDARAALDAMLAQPEVDPARIAVFGQSLGGAIALRAFREPGPIRSMVLESPFASWRLAAATALGGASPGAVSRALAALLISDDERPDEAISALDIPILIIHGDADRVVPVVHGRRLRDAAPSRVTLVEFSGGEHNSLRETHPEADRTVIEFLHRTLGTENAAGPK